MAIYTCSNKEEKKIYQTILISHLNPLLMFRNHQNSRTLDMFLHFRSTTKLPRNARGNIIPKKTDTIQK